jgi:hypothetical protein
MALQINTGLTTTDGGSVASGAYAIFSTRFPHRGLNYSVEILLFRSLAALDNGLSAIQVTQIPVYYYTKTLTEQQFATLTPIVIHQHVKEFLEGYVGIGKVDIVF